MSQNDLVLSHSAIPTRSSESEEVQYHNQRLQIDVGFQGVELGVDVSMDAVKATRRHLIVLLVDETNADQRQMIMGRSSSVRRERTLRGQRTGFEQHRAWILRLAHKVLSGSTSDMHYGPEIIQESRCE